MAGSNDAKRAWVHLRGPYLLAYLAYFIFSVTAPTGPPENGGIWWQWVATVMGMAAIAGSISSWMVVSHVRPKELWRRAESLEVSALRVISGFEIAFGIWGMIRPSFPGYVAMLHILLGLLMVGILSNMTWHKVRMSGDGVED